MEKQRPLIPLMGLTVFGKCFGTINYKLFMAYISGGSELLDPVAIFKRLGIGQGAVIADLGCGGVGHFIIPAARLVGDKTTAYAVDIVKTVLGSVVSRARTEGVNNIKPIWSNLEMVGATKISDASLDFAFLKNVLFQSKNHEPMMTEAIRLLKPGGKLLVIDWGNAMTSFGPPPADRVKPEMVKVLAQKLKLKLLDEFEVGSYHYRLIFQK